MFKVEDKNSKLMSFCIDDELLEKYQTIWTKIEVNVLAVYDDRWIKTKIRTYSNKVYTNFLGFNVAEDDIECEPFTIIFVDSLLIYCKKYYFQVYSDKCPYKIVNKQKINYLDENLFED